MLADNRMQLRALFPDGGAPDGTMEPGVFPRSATIRWLIDRRVDFAVLVGGWLLRRRHPSRPPPQKSGS